MVTERKLRRIMTENMKEVFGFAYEEEIAEIVDKIIDEIQEDDEVEFDSDPQRYSDDETFDD